MKCCTISKSVSYLLLLLQGLTPVKLKPVLWWPWGADNVTLRKWVTVAINNMIISISNYPWNPDQVCLAKPNNWKRFFSSNRYLPIRHTVTGNLIRLNTTTTTTAVTKSMQQTTFDGTSSVLILPILTRYCTKSLAALLWASFLLVEFPTPV